VALKLVVLRGSRAGTEHRLDGPEVIVLGSAPDAHVCLADDGVHANHARIFKDDDRLIMMDVSGAGVLVNGRSEIQAELKAGDELGLGGAVLRVTPAGVPLEAVLKRPPSAIASGTGAELRILKGPDEGKTFGLAGAKATLGRGVTADVALLDMKCSREHCAIEKRPEGWVLVDLGSTNGTRLNEVKLETRGLQLLKHGDKLRLGGTIAEFRAGSAPAVVRAAPPPAPRAPEPVAAPPGGVFEIDLDSMVSEPAAPVAADDALNRAAPTTKFRDASMFRRDPPQSLSASRFGNAALEGELENMGFVQIVQFLNLSHKSGELIIEAPYGELGIAFHQGEVRDAWGVPQALDPLQHFYAIARVRRGRFRFHENAAVREARIRTGTLALLMEAMRLVDEATDPGD
jgi:pSer/pThr/pTyr-binding forkhead associated (FHA) protein